MTKMAGILIAALVVIGFCWGQVHPLAVQPTDAELTRQLHYSEIPLSQSGLYLGVNKKGEPAWTTLDGKFYP